MSSVGLRNGRVAGAGGIVWLLSLEKSKKVLVCGEPESRREDRAGERIEVGVKRCKKSQKKKGTSWVVIVSLHVVIETKEKRKRGQGGHHESPSSRPTVPC